MDRVSRSKPDETIYCEKCEVALRYDRVNQRWEAQWTPSEHPEVKRCIVKNKTFGEEKRYDHVPLGNISRLLRAARRMNRGNK